MQPPGTCLSLQELVRYLSNAVSSGASIAGVASILAFDSPNSKKTANELWRNNSGFEFHRTIQEITRTNTNTY